MQNYRSKFKIGRMGKPAVSRVSRLRCDTRQLCCCENLYSGFEFQEMQNAQPPDNKGVYVIRVKKRGKVVKGMMEEVRRAVENLKWDIVGKRILNRIDRLIRINKCPLIYIGSAGTQEGNRKTLKKRYEEFSGRHTAMFPIWALVYFGWELEFGWKKTKNPRDAEDKLKRKYKKQHGNRLPALVGK